MSKGTKSSSIWSRRWVWTSLAGLVIFGAGLAVGSGESAECEAAGQATSQIEVVSNG